MDTLTAKDISIDHSLWTRNRAKYLECLIESALVAKEDSIYKEHLHPIIISGNLEDNSLNFQTIIYSEIAYNLYPVLKEKLDHDGIIVVLQPPSDDSMLELMRNSHISTVVFNQEVASCKARKDYCPGKYIISRDYIDNRLEAAINYFGRNHVWTNFVFGLEPIDYLLEKCKELCVLGVVPSANIFHRDSGSILANHDSPSYKDTYTFFNHLSFLYQKYNMKPFYCSKALRTSLTNEAYDGRF